MLPEKVTHAGGQAVKCRVALRTGDAHRGVILQGGPPQHGHCCGLVVPGVVDAAPEQGPAHDDTGPVMPGYLKDLDARQQTRLRSRYHRHARDARAVAQVSGESLAPAPDALLAAAHAHTCRQRPLAVEDVGQLQPLLEGGRQRNDVTRAQVRAGAAAASSLALLHPRRCPGQVVMDHPPQPGEIESLGGDVSRDQVARGQWIRRCVTAKPVEDRSSGRPQRTDAGRGSTAPGRTQRGEAVAEVAHRGTAGGEDERGNLIGEKRAQPGGTCIINVARRIRSATDTREPKKVGDRKDARAGLSHQLPQHELRIVGAGEATNVAPADGATGPGRVHGVQQEALVCRSCFAEGRRARRCGTPEHPSKQRCRGTVG